MKEKEFYQIYNHLLQTLTPEQRITLACGLFDTEPETDESQYNQLVIYTGLTEGANGIQKIQTDI